MCEELHSQEMVVCTYGHSLNLTRSPPPPPPAPPIFPRPSNKLQNSGNMHALGYMACENFIQIR